jgi:hypothetical protein
VHHPLDLLRQWREANQIKSCCSTCMKLRSSRCLLKATQPSTAFLCRTALLAAHQRSRQHTSRRSKLHQAAGNLRTFCRSLSPHLQSKHLLIVLLVSGRAERPCDRFAAVERAKLGVRAPLQQTQPRRQVQLVLHAGGGCGRPGERLAQPRERPSDTLWRSAQQN